MKLHEIIKKVGTLDQLSYEQIQPYLKSVYVYTKDYFCSEPILMVTFVCNAFQGCIITCEQNYLEDLNNHLLECELTPGTEDWQCEEETINFNSKFLKDLL